MIEVLQLHPALAHYGHMIDRDGARALLLRGGYHLVARVDTTNMVDAVVRTSSDDNWVRNPGLIVPVEVESCRPTGIGDVLRTDGKLMMIGSHGFEKLT
jgi:hypothetical protein